VGERGRKRINNDLMHLGNLGPGSAGERNWRKTILHLQLNFVRCIQEFHCKKKSNIKETVSQD
jgi:hypothetical protein